MTEKTIFTPEELEEAYEKAGFGERRVGAKDYFIDANHVLAYALGHTLEAYLKLKQLVEKGKIDSNHVDAITNERKSCLEAALYMYADNYKEWEKRAHNGIDRENAYEANCWICVACCKVGEEIFSAVWDKQAFRRGLDPYRPK
jgi:hypothetical protein